MNPRLMLVFGLLNIFNELAAAMADGRVSAEEAFNILQSLAKVFGFSFDTNEFKIFIEQDEDVHLIIKAPLVARAVKNINRLFL